MIKGTRTKNTPLIICIIFIAIFIIFEEVQAQFGPLSDISPSDIDGYVFTNPYPDFDPITFDHIIDFEDLPVGTEVYDQYKDMGVLFTGSFIGSQSLKLPTVCKPSVATASGTQAITVDNQSCELFCPTYFSIYFNAPQSMAGAHVGVNSGTDKFWEENGVIVYMRAYDRNDNLLKEVAILLLPGLKPIKKLILVSLETESIWKAQIEFWRLKVNTRIDDVGFSTISPLPEDTQPPKIQFLKPQNGQLFDSFEGGNYFPLDGFIKEKDK